MFRGIQKGYWTVVALIFICGAFYTTDLDPLSLEEVKLNVRNITSPDTKILMYNRISKTGSTTMLNFLKELSKVNNFTHVCSPVYNRFNIEINEQEDMIQEMLDLSRESAISFDRQFFFFENQKAIESGNFAWITAVRDPVERLISKFYYRRKLYIINKNKEMGNSPDASIEDDITKSDWFLKNLDECMPECLNDWELKDQHITWFCGNHPNCSKLNNYWALQQAKQNVEKYYSVVGILEDLPLSLQVLEHILPRFFKGVSERHSNQNSSIQNENKETKKPTSEETRSLLRKHVPLDIEFYQYLRQRLNIQAMTLGLN